MRHYSAIKANGASSHAKPGEKFTCVVLSEKASLKKSACSLTAVLEKETLEREQNDWS